jgi:hypothetical protein
MNFMLRKLTSTLAPSSVPIVSAPFSMNFMLPVPLASVPAVLIYNKEKVLKHL